MSRSGIQDVVSATPSIATTYDADIGTATPSGNNLFIIGGSGINTTATGDTITIDATAGGFTWQTVAGTSDDLEANNGYIPLNGGLTTFTLPATGSVGDQVQVAGFGAGGWVIAQNASQVIHLNATDTTTGVGGSIASTNQYNTIHLLCVTTDTDWVVLDSSGTFTLV